MTKMTIDEMKERMGEADDSTTMKMGQDRISSEEELRRLREEVTSTFAELHFEGPGNHIKHLARDLDDACVTIASLIMAFTGQREDLSLDDVVMKTVHMSEFIRYRFGTNVGICIMLLLGLEVLGNTRLTDGETLRRSGILGDALRDVQKKKGEANDEPKGQEVEETETQNEGTEEGLVSEPQVEAEGEGNSGEVDGEKAEGGE